MPETVLTWSPDGQWIEGSIKPGDRLVSANGEAVAGKHPDGMLEDTVGKRVVLGIETAGKTHDAVVRPVASGPAMGLLYRQWAEVRRALVDRVSGGRWAPFTWRI